MRYCAGVIAVVVCLLPLTVSGAAGKSETTQSVKEESSSKEERDLYKKIDSEWGRVWAEHCAKKAEEMRLSGATVGETIAVLNPACAKIVAKNLKMDEKKVEEIMAWGRNEDATKKKKGGPGRQE